MSLQASRSGTRGIGRGILRQATSPPTYKASIFLPSLPLAQPRELQLSATTSRYGTKCLPSNWQFEVGKWWWTSGCGVDDFWGQRICGSHPRLWGLSCQGPTPLWSVSSTQLSWAPLSIILLSKWWIKQVPLNWAILAAIALLELGTTVSIRSSVSFLGEHHPCHNVEWVQCTLFVSYNPTYPPIDKPLPI